MVQKELEQARMFSFFAIMLCMAVCQCQAEDTVEESFKLANEQTPSLSLTCVFCSMRFRSLFCTFTLFSSSCVLCLLVCLRHCAYCIRCVFTRSSDIWSLQDVQHNTQHMSVVNLFYVLCVHLLIE